MRPIVVSLVCLIPSFALSQSAKLVDSEKERRLRRLIPLTEDESINKITASSRLILYTREEMPLVYWLNGTFHDGRYDVGPDSAPKPHNSTREFPWNAPGGTHRSKNSYSFKFLWLPHGRKIVYGRRSTLQWNRLPLQPSRGPAVIGWLYPRGTVFGEVLFLKNSKGADFAYEMRLKIKEDKEWAVEIFRPFPTFPDLVAAIPASHPMAARLRQRLPRMKARMSDRAHPHTRAIDVVAELEVLPDFRDEALVQQLLRRPFRSALGQVWRDNVIAPTTKASFSIVPATYDGAFLGNDRSSCLRCHETTNMDVSKFHVGRDWYGRVRGYDQIFSFSLADPKSLIRDAASGPIRFHPGLRNIIEPYDKGRHQDYHDTTKE